MLRRGLKQSDNEVHDTRSDNDTDQDAELKEMRKAYEIRRVQDGIESLLDVTSWFFPLFAFLTCIKRLLALIGWFEFFCWMLPTGIMFSLMMSFRQRLRDYCRQHATHAIAFQTVVWIIGSITFAIGSYATKEELARHRHYLTTMIPAFSFFSIVAYLPPKVYMPLCCCWNGILWWCWHWAVGFWNIPCATYGMLASILSYYTYKIVDRHTWNEFKATQALDNDRQFLQAINETFKGMLSSLFDASCSCDQDGLMISWTPQLKDLLGCFGPSGSLLHICDLAASEVESARLRHFLEQTIQSESHRAHTIQTSLRAGGMLGPKATGTNFSREVKLFGIVLPARTGELEGGRKRSVFIGLQGQGDTTCLLNTCPPPVFGSSTDVETRLLSKPAVDGLSSISEVFDLEEHDSIPGSLSYTNGASSDGGTLYSMISKPHHCKAATALSIDASVQTESELAPEHLPQCPYCSLRTAQRSLTRDEQCLADWKAKRVDAKKLRLDSKKRVLKRFQETPPKTMEACIEHLAKSFNARGQGCCAFHVTIAKLVDVMGTLTSRSCSRDFSPYCDWQCHYCKAMNDADPADDDEDEPVRCSTCDAEKQVQQSSKASASGN